MAHISSEISDGPPKDESLVQKPLQILFITLYTYWGLGFDIYDWRICFSGFVWGTCNQRLCYTYSVSEANESNDFLSLTFPKKNFGIYLKMISFNLFGAMIVEHVINKEFFKNDVLERKASFRIFETKRMKSSILHLNLYGFSKKRETFQRSASISFWRRKNNLSFE